MTDSGFHGAFSWISFALPYEIRLDGEVFFDFRLDRFGLVGVRLTAKANEHSPFACVDVVHSTWRNNTPDALGLLYHTRATVWLPTAYARERLNAPAGAVDVRHEVWEEVSALCASAIQVLNYLLSLIRYQTKQYHVRYLTVNDVLAWSTGLSRILCVTDDWPEVGTVITHRTDPTGEAFLTVNQVAMRMEAMLQGKWASPVWLELLMNAKYLCSQDQFSASIVSAYISLELRLKDHLETYVKAPTTGLLNREIRKRLNIHLGLAEDHNKARFARIEKERDRAAHGRLGAEPYDLDANLRFLKDCAELGNEYEGMLAGESALLVE